jgi:hypothetical protein
LARFIFFRKTGILAKEQVNQQNLSFLIMVARIPIGTGLMARSKGDVSISQYRCSASGD